MTEALVFEPNSPDILHERGKCLYALFPLILPSFYFLMPVFFFEFAINSGIVNFKSKDFSAAVKDLSICLKQEKDNKSAYTYLVRLLCVVILGFESNHELKKNS